MAKMNPPGETKLESVFRIGPNGPWVNSPRKNVSGTENPLRFVAVRRPADSDEE